MKKQLTAFLRSLMEQRGLDSIVVSGEGNIAYITGFSPSMRDGCVYVIDNKNNKEKLFIHHGFDKDTAAETYDKEKITVTYDYPAAMRKMLHEGSRIGVIGKDAMNYELYHTLLSLDDQLVALDAEFMARRHIKFDGEIDMLGRASQLTCECLYDTMLNMRPGMSENQVAAYFAYQGMQKGCQLSFTSCVASGHNSSYMAKTASEKIVRRGEAVLFDVGLRYKNYCADVSRMAYLGTPTQDFMDLHNRLTSVYHDLLARIKPGIVATELHDYAVLNYEKNKLGELRHRCGHGCGIDTSLEGIDLKLDNNRILEPGMVLAIELSAESADNSYGTKQEDTLVVTERGYRCLSLMTYEPIVI